MAKIKEFFSTYKKRICAIAGASICAVSLILTIICYLVGAFIEKESSITFIDSIAKVFEVFAGASIPVLIDGVFGLVHLIFIAIIVLITIPFVRRAIKFIIALVKKDDDKLVEEMTFIRERGLSVCINLGLFVIFETLLSSYSLSAFTIVCLSFAVASFAISTTCLMFVAHDDIPLPSHIATECVRYVFAPLIVGVAFIFAIPSGAVSNLYFKIMNVVASLETMFESDQIMAVIRSLYYIAFEGICAIITVILFIKLLANLIDNITPNSRTYVADKHSAKKIFLILGIISGARVVLRFIVHNFLIDEGISADFLQMIFSWFNSVRNDVLPLTLVCFVGYCLLFSNFIRNEPKEDPKEETGTFSLGNSFFTNLKPGQLE